MVGRGDGEEGGRGGLHSDPSTGLVVMPYSRRGGHFRLGQCMARSPRAHPVQRMDLDRIIITRRRDLTGGIKRRVADAEPTFMFADQSRLLPASTTTAHLPQVPDPHEAVERGGGDEVRVSTVQGEAADFLLAELEDIGLAGRAGVDAADVAVEAAEVEEVGGLGVDFDAGEGFVGGGVGGRVDLRGVGFGEVEEAEGGVVGGGVEVGRVEGGELK